MTFERGRTVPKSQHPVLSSENKLKLAVFSTNCSHGVTMSDQPGMIEVEWDEQIRLAQLADDTGIEAMIPIARWKGMGGKTDFQHRSFDTLTWAAGLAAKTRRIGVFSTVHVTTIHPVRLAKTAATIDHISAGRFGLNIVAGANEKEVAMFGNTLLPHDQRYDVAGEWVEFVQALWTNADVFDWNGTYYNSPAAYSNPQPLQQPGPVLMGAGGSERGVAFATQYCDLSFIGAPDIDVIGKSAKQIKSTARERHGRDISIFSNAYIICEPTEQQARDKYRRISEADGDRVALKNMVSMFMPNSASLDWESVGPQLMAGWGAYPLVGTPEQIAEKLTAFANAGVDGLTLCWPDYFEGLQQFGEQIQPLLVQNGVRTPPAHN